MLVLKNPTHQRLMTEHILIASCRFFKWVRRVVRVFAKVIRSRQLRAVALLARSLVGAQWQIL